LVYIYSTNSATGECDHYAASEDLFDVPPWISGWFSLDFTPGLTYYMGVDGWEGVEGEFCITVVTCNVECGDGSCAPVEEYCDCPDDCLCAFGNISAVAFDEETGNLAFSTFWCSELDRLCRKYKHRYRYNIKCRTNFCWSYG